MDQTDREVHMIETMFDKYAVEINVALDSGADPLAVAKLFRQRFVTEQKRELSSFDALLLLVSLLESIDRRPH